MSKLILDHVIDMKTLILTLIDQSFYQQLRDILKYRTLIINENLLIVVIKLFPHQNFSKINLITSLAND